MELESTFFSYFEKISLSLTFYNTKECLKQKPQSTLTFGNSQSLYNTTEIIKGEKENQSKNSQNRIGNSVINNDLLHEKIEFFFFLKKSCVNQLSKAKFWRVEYNCFYTRIVRKNKEIQLILFPDPLENFKYFEFFTESLITANRYLEKFQHIRTR